ncbi:MAG: cobalamin-dependent protein [Deltaproteobacteria bacterium]|uniref:Cobalamin-dependent protein n=1 Tax=Candidatus Zymogenus saltonus TaxID=2844893 RepID=A0A9D8KEG4_9DELT|nr:cobalamin-dependent protein [Candidatus Zymogenus saltonus]
MPKSKLETRKRKYVKPYGDTMNDGAVQLSFTLPGVTGELATEAAKRLAQKMGIDDPYVSSATDIGSDMTFIVLYGRIIHDVDITKIEVFEEEDEKPPDMKVIDKMIEDNLKRKIVVVGACIGNDAHTVGIDAIMNMKGYAGDYGLERYKNIEAINMGAQVTGEEILERAINEKADAVLVSQVVTQKDVHIGNLSRLVDLFDEEYGGERPILIAGGPRITDKLAVELGFDRGYGGGTLPSHVAYFIYKKLLHKAEER